jgi:hypothetical protein
MTLQQMRKEIGELKEKIELKESKDSGLIILETPEVVRCSKEVKLAQEKVRQHLIDSGIPEDELREHERDCFICDDRVIEAQHNLLRAISNTRKTSGEPYKIKYLFDVELQACL